MLGWINKKIATGASGSSKGGSNGSSGEAASGGGGRGGTPAEGNSQHDQQQRGLPPSAHRSSQGRKSSFLDAVGGAIGRTSRKKEGRSEAAVLAEQLDAQRAEKISCVAFKLVREIQRILKEARETQTVTNAAAGGAGAAPSRTPAATPPPPSRKDASAEATGTAAAAAAAAAAAESGSKRNRWAGTNELLTLLDGGSPGGAGEVEDKVERYGSMAEVQAKMSDLVEQALVPESHGDLCGQLLEAASGDGHHPAFVKLCVDAGLPSNLVHCLRIMRVVEFESAMHDTGEGGGDDNNGRSVDTDDRGFTADDDETTDATASGSSSPSATETTTKAPGAAITAPAQDRPQTQRATERIGRLLVTLCRDKSAGVGEQIKPHLPGLLSLAVSAYPPNGAHVQETARAVVEALMGGCLNSSMVWLLHYNKVG